MLQTIGEALGWIALSIAKFLFTPSVMIGAGKSFVYTLSISLLGAFLGFFIFYYGGSYIFDRIGSKKKKVKITAKKIKRLRWIKSKGLTGLMLIGPVLSVPVCSILAARFFGHDKKTVPLMLLTFVIWGIALTSISYLVKAGVS